MSRAAQPFGTIIVDASFDVSGAAGWAAWITCDPAAQRYTYAAPFRARCISTTEAESLACVNALYVARKRAPHIARWLIQTDCLGAIALFRYQRKPNTSAEIAALRMMRSAFTELSRIYFKHVRGHTPTNTTKPRYFVQRWCDHAAYVQMNEVRKTLTQKQGTLS